MLGVPPACGRGRRVWVVNSPMPSATQWGHWCTACAQHTFYQEKLGVYGVPLLPPPHLLFVPHHDPAFPLHTTQHSLIRRHIISGSLGCAAATSEKLGDLGQ